MHSEYQSNFRASGSRDFLLALSNLLLIVPGRNSAVGRSEPAVWQPLQFDRESSMSLAVFHHSWAVDSKTGPWTDVKPDGKGLEVASIPSPL